MPRAVRSLFVAAALLLLVSVVALGIRSSGDDRPPSAIGPATDRATEEATDDADGNVTGPTEEPDEPAVPSETLLPDESESPSAEETSTSDGSVTATDDPSEAAVSAGDGDGDSRTSATGRRAIDDMPDTGGGTATALGGLVVLGATAGIARRR